MSTRTIRVSQMQFSTSSKMFACFTKLKLAGPFRSFSIEQTSDGVKIFVALSVIALRTLHSSFRWLPHDIFRAKDPVTSFCRSMVSAELSESLNLYSRLCWREARKSARTVTTRLFESSPEFAIWTGRKFGNLVVDLRPGI